MMNALVVDDNPLIRKLLTEMLRKYGISSVEASNGQEAFILLHDNASIELVFLDWNMPVLNGIDLLRLVRSDTELKNLKVIMITGNIEMDFVDTALTAGVDEYIMLPITTAILEEKLALLGIYPL